MFDLKTNSCINANSSFIIYSNYTRVLFNAHLGTAPMRRWCPCCRAVVPCPLQWWKRALQTIRCQIRSRRRPPPSSARVPRPSAPCSGWPRSFLPASACTAVPSASNLNTSSPYKKDTPFAKLWRRSSSTGQVKILNDLSGRRHMTSALRLKTVLSKLFQYQLRP